jgi:hypothetical protein
LTLLLLKQLLTKLFSTLPLLSPLPTPLRLTRLKHCLTQLVLKPLPTKLFSTQQPHKPPPTRPCWMPPLLKLPPIRQSWMQLPPKRPPTKLYSTLLLHRQLLTLHCPRRAEP